MRTFLTVFFVCAAVPPFGRVQPLPSPGDGDIRVVYWDLRDQTEVSLTIQPHGAAGAPAPAGLALTFSRVSSGRTPPPPASSTTVIDARAYPGTAWEPKPELSFEIGGKQVPVVSPVRDPLVVGNTGPDYLSAFATVRLLEQIGAGDHITANVLGFRFDLTDEQRAACRAFVERLKSGEPARGK